MKKWIKRIVLAGFVVLLIVGYFLATADKPVAVDLATVTLGPMRVTVNEEGIAQVRDVYTVSSPIAGHLERVKLDQGDRVKANQTIIASIHPLDPPFLDDRTRTELSAAVEAANSAVLVAKVENQRAQTALNQAISNYKRLRKLAEDNLVSTSEVENSESNVKLGKVQVESTLANIRLREAELNSVKARLQQTEDIGSSPDSQGCCVEIIAPVDGVILDVIVRSETPVSVGTPIASVGDPGKLEIVVDLLTTDAVKVKPGNKVRIVDWGGESTLNATVRRIDPAAFTKVSALGIEEQRVNTVLDLDASARNHGHNLGHGYRIFAEVGVWSAESVLQVPIAAMFRSNGQWSVFIASGGIASLRIIKVGQLNNSHAQVLEGLAQDETIVLYPSDMLENGSLITQR